MKKKDPRQFLGIGIDADKAIAFAEANGWRIGQAFHHVHLRQQRGMCNRCDHRAELLGHMFHPIRLVHPFDHGVYFWNAWLPAAVVGHPYPENDARSMRKWAAPDLIATPLGDRWYDGDGTRGWIFTHNDDYLKEK